jgi:hypothetical protein
MMNDLMSSGQCVCGQAYQWSTVSSELVEPVTQTTILARSMYSQNLLGIPRGQSHSQRSIGPAHDGCGYQINLLTGPVSYITVTKLGGAGPSYITVTKLGRGWAGSAQ